MEEPANYSMVLTEGEIAWNFWGKEISIGNGTTALPLVLRGTNARATALRGTLRWVRNPKINYRYRNPRFTDAVAGGSCKACVEFERTTCMAST